MRRFVTLIEPALILVIGLIVAGLVFSVLSAIVGINALVI
jgi:type II secretory pathway component PulF